MKDFPRSSLEFSVTDWQTLGELEVQAGADAERPIQPGLQKPSIRLNCMTIYFSGFADPPGKP